MRKHKSDRWILVLTCILMGIGLIVIYTIGPMRANFMSAAYGVEVAENSFFVHQIISVILALLAAAVAFFVPYEFLRKTSKWVMILGIVSCLFLVIMSKVGSGLAVCENGACRWIRITSSVSVQPVEILKLGLVMYLAQLIAKRKEEGNYKFLDFWMPYLTMSLLALLFTVYFQKDLGSAVVLGAIILGMLLMSGVKMKYFIIACAVALAGATVAIVIEPHRMERLMTFQDSEDADTYHIDNALLAIGTGGMTGVGVGNTVQATGYLPESINDSVFAVMGEAFGFLGLVLVIGVFVFLLMRIIKVYERRNNEEYGLIAIGVFAWVAVQTAVNICAMIGLIPLTGITLPLLSYGGTSMAFTAFALGLVAQLSCYEKRGREMKEKMVSSRGIE